MKGKDRFTGSEADQIRRLLDLMRRAETGTLQKVLRDRLRAMGFYISDFARGPAGFTRSDFDDLVRDGRVTISDGPQASAAGASRSTKPPRPRRTARNRKGMRALSLAERTRRRYRPDEVRVLFIGESPPAGGTFFYHANSKLYDATREAFEAVIPALRRTDDFLECLQTPGLLPRRSLSRARQPPRSEGP